MYIIFEISPKPCKAKQGVFHKPEKLVVVSWLKFAHHRGCCQLFIFLLRQNHRANINETLHKASLGEGDSSLFKSKVTSFSKGGELISKTHWRKFTTYATTGPISTKIGTKHRWLFTNKGPFNSQIELFNFFYF